jgi:hypothetical protein
MIFIVHTIAGDQLLLKVCWPDAYHTVDIEADKFAGKKGYASQLSVSDIVDSHLSQIHNLN